MSASVRKKLRVGVLTTAVESKRTVVVENAADFVRAMRCWNVVARTCARGVRDARAGLYSCTEERKHMMRSCVVVT